MGLQLHRTLWVLALFSSVAIYIVYKAAAFTGDALSPQGCRMSWMFPEYILQSHFNSSWTPLAKRYSLWLYREGDGWDTHRKLTGVPVLFIPGNAGSSHQVRSIASSAARQYFSARGGVVAPEFYSRSQKPLDFFATEFNEDFSALHGPTLTSQSTYVHAAIAYILSQYPSGTRIFIIGHSMGGIVAASVLPFPFVSGIITLSTPHALPPARYSSDLEHFYKRINDRLRNADLMTPFISICGGATDLMIPSETCYLPSSTDAKNQKTIYTSSMEGCWSGTSHQVSVWCHQVRWRIARAILELEPEESEFASFTTLSKWIRDQSDALELSSVVRHEAAADVQWATLQDGHNLIVEKSTLGTRGYLIPIGTTKDSFTLLLTGGRIASVGPFNTPDVEIRILWCSTMTTTPSCQPVTSGKVFLMPNPKFASTFPATGEGVDEADGVVVVEMESVKPPPLHTHIGVLLVIREASPLTSLIAGFEQQQRIESRVSFASLLWRSHSVDIVAGYMRAYVAFSRLTNSPLLVYRIKPVLSGNCKGATLAPTISHAASNEQQYYLASENSLLLHSNVGGPFLRSSANSLQISLLSSGSCSVTRLEVSLDLYASLGRCGIRYFGAVVAWAMGLSGLILANGFKHWSREGAFPSVVSSAISVISTDLKILTVILFLASLLGLPPEFLLGNRGDATFAMLTPLVLWIACGCVCISVIALEFCLWFWGKVLGAVWTSSSSGESRGPKWSIVHIAIITGVTLTLIPYHVIFVICCVIQFFTTAATAKAEPSERSIQSGFSTSARHQNIHVLLVLLWLLPNMAPSLAVWIRTIATTGSITLFNSDHSPLPVLPFLILVEIANARPQGPLIPKNRPPVLEWATKGILITASAVPLALGARYPFFAFNAGAVIFVCLLAHCW